MANQDSEISFSQIVENFRYFVFLPSDFIPNEVKLVVFVHFVYHLKEIDETSSNKSSSFFCTFESYFAPEYAHEIVFLREYLVSEDTKKLLSGMKGTFLWKISNAEPFDLSLDNTKLENASLLLVCGTGKYIPLIVSLYFPNLFHRSGLSKKRKNANEEASTTTLFKKVITRLKLPLESIILVQECACKTYLNSLFVDANERTFYFIDHTSSRVHYVHNTIFSSSSTNRHVLERRDSATTVHAMKSYSGGVVIGAGNVLEKLSRDSNCESKKLTFPSSYVNCFDVNKRGNLIGGCFGKTIFLYDMDNSLSSSSLQETEDYEASMNEYFSSLYISESGDSPSLYIGSTAGVVRKWDLRKKRVSLRLPKLPRSSSVVDIKVSGHYIAQISKTNAIESSIAYVIDERFTKDPVHQYFSGHSVQSSFLQGNFFGISHGNTVTAWNLLDVSLPCNEHILEGYTISECVPTKTLNSLVCSVI
jgi:hypothetical protein